MKTVSIGIMREDGDFAILATLNNNDGHITQQLFDVLVHHVKRTLEQSIGDTLTVLERQDAPDYVCVDEDCWG